MTRMSLPIDTYSLYWSKYGATNPLESQGTIDITYIVNGSIVFEFIVDKERNNN